MAVRECVKMHPSFGCARMDTAKELILYGIQEGDTLHEPCREQCCVDCEREICAFRCMGGMTEEDEIGKMEEIAGNPLLMAAYERGLLEV